MIKYLHKNRQDTLWNLIKCSVRFVTLDNVRKNEPKSFVKGKMAFFEKSLSNEVLGPIEMNFHRAQKMSKHFRDRYILFLNI